VPLTRFLFKGRVDGILSTRYFQLADSLDGACGTRDFVAPMPRIPRSLS